MKVFTKVLLFNLIFTTNFAFGIELDKKSQAQAMKDLADSKIQASVMLKEKLKHYDLNRLPPQYQALLKKHLFGNVPSPEELKALKARYDKIISDTLQNAAKGPGGDIKRLEKLFSDIVSGKVQYASKRIPFTPNSTKFLRPTNPTNQVKSLVKTPTNLKKEADLANNLNQTRKITNGPKAQAALAEFVNANKSKKMNKTIFSIHSSTYLNDIYKSIK